MDPSLAVLAVLGVLLSSAKIGLLLLFILELCNVALKWRFSNDWLIPNQVVNSLKKSYVIDEK